MRQRKIKNLDAKYEAYNDILVYDPAELRGHWNQRSGGKKIYLEIGCGKGRFITETAKRRPEDFFIAVEGHKSVMLRALEKVKEQKIDNVIFIPEYITDLTEWFDDAEADGIFLNFSDPLPKNYSAKKRLTHRSKLKQYFRVLKDDGIVRFKTDNTDLFEFSVLEVIASDLKILKITRDLHNCEYDEDNIRTEYEDKFSGLGEKIKMMEIGRIRSREEYEMGMAALNGREIPKEDKVFGINGRAKKALAEKGKDAVINATIGTLMDDQGNLIVLSSVDEAVKMLKPEDYSAYAPIAGIPGFKNAVQRAALGHYTPEAFVGIVSTPGGTASISNAVANYTCPGDRILSHDWHWPNYNNIAREQGRELETFEMFDADGNFNFFDFEYKVKKLLRIQDRLLLIMNSPANNPTGYSLSDEEWEQVVKILNSIPEDKKVTLICDVAYIDFAGEEDEMRSFLPLLGELKANILPILAYSASKTFTFYGFRCAAMVAMHKDQEVIDEFERVCSYSARALWSNSPRAPQTVIAKIYEDPELLEKVSKERKIYRDMLLARGHAFEEEAAKVGLKTVPFRGGFFITVPCEDPDAVGAKLEAMDAYCIPMSKGVRVSVASIPEEQCRRLPAMFVEAMK